LRFFFLLTIARWVCWSLIALHSFFVFRFFSSCARFRFANAQSEERFLKRCCAATKHKAPQRRKVRPPSLFRMDAPCFTVQQTHCLFNFFLLYCFYQKLQLHLRIWAAKTPLFVRASKISVLFLVNFTIPFPIFLLLLLFLFCFSAFLL